MNEATPILIVIVLVLAAIWLIRHL